MKYIYIYVHRVSETTRINTTLVYRMLSRKVLYHFAIFVIINELIFEDCRKEACSAGPSANVSAWRDTPASLSARGVVYCGKNVSDTAPLVRS